MCTLICLSSACARLFVYPLHVHVYPLHVHVRWPCAVAQGLQKRSSHGGRQHPHRPCHLLSYVRAFMCTCACIHVCTCVHSRLCICACFTCAYVRAFTCACVLACIRLCACVRACTHVCACARAWHAAAAGGNAEDEAEAREACKEAEITAICADSTEAEQLKHLDSTANNFKCVWGEHARTGTWGIVRRALYGPHARSQPPNRTTCTRTLVPSYLSWLCEGSYL